MNYIKCRVFKIQTRALSKNEQIIIHIYKIASKYPAQCELNKTRGKLGPSFTQDPRFGNTLQKPINIWNYMKTKSTAIIAEFYLVVLE